MNQAIETVRGLIESGHLTAANWEEAPQRLLLHGIPVEQYPYWMREAVDLLGVQYSLGQRWKPLMLLTLRAAENLVNADGTTKNTIRDRWKMLIHEEAKKQLPPANANGRRPGSLAAVAIEMLGTYRAARAVLLLGVKTDQNDSRPSEEVANYWLEHFYGRLFDIIEATCGLEISRGG